MIEALELLTRRLWVGVWRMVPLIVMLGLALWGWFAFTLSPVQRFYFPAYVGSSLHLTDGQELDRIAWLVKTGPKKKIDIAETADLVPTVQGAAGFILSPKALREGWTGAKRLMPLGYPGGSQVPFLQEHFFGGDSLSRLLFRPASVLAFPLILWAVFVRWRYKRDQEEYEPAWAWVNSAWVDEGTSGVSDVLQFAREMTKHGVVVAVGAGRLLAKVGRTGARIWRERGSVSPSVAVSPVRQITMAVTTKSEPFVSAPFPKPQAEVLVASAPLSSPVQLGTEPPAKLSRAQTLPFRKRQAELRAQELKAAGDWTEPEGDAR